MTVLASTKVAVPPVRPGYISRPRLEQVIRTSAAHRLLLVSAPTGYGKSMLLAGWHSAAGTPPTAWLSLDAHDNDPVLLTRYLIAALRSAAVEFAPGTELLVRVPGAGPDAWMASVVNDLAAHGAGITLVLEDYHLIDDVRCHTIVQYLLDRAPASLRMIMATRVNPPLALGALRAAGQLCELRAEDLRFTASETARMLVDEERLPITRSAVTELNERTEGWPAGLYLAALWLRHRPDPEGDARRFVGSNRHVVDYLIEVVLEQLEQPVREALLRTSLVERLCAPLCTVLADRAGADLLRELERSNLFLVPLDADRTWYRYHHLFRDTLRSELHRQRPDLVRDLHRRAAGWYQGAGMVTEAIEHALAGDDADLAAALVGAHYLDVARAGQDATIRRWLGGFTPAQLGSHPELGIVGGLTIGVSGGTSAELRRWLALAGDRPAPATPDQAARGSGWEVDFIRSAFGYDDISVAIAAALRALRILTAAQHGLRPAALANLGQLHYFAGDRDAARAASLDALRDPQVVARPYAHITALTTLSLVELDEGAVRAAERPARQALDRAREVGLDAHQVAGLAHVAIGRTLGAGGQYAAGDQRLGHGLELVAGGVLPIREAYALVHAVPARRRAGDPAAGAALLDRAEALLADFSDAGIVGALVHRARLHLDHAVRHRSSPGQLSHAELAVLRLLEKPLSRRDIAGELSVSLNTVKTHITAVYRALGASSRDEAVRLAREQRILP